MEVTIGGVKGKIKNVDISTTPVGITVEQPATSVAFQTRSGTEFRLYEVDDPTTGDFWTVKGGAPISFDVATSSTGKPVFFVRTTSGTDVLEIVSLH